MFAIQALRENCRDVATRTYCASGYAYQHDNARKNRDLGLFVGLGSAGVMAIGSAVVGFAHVRSPKREERSRTSATVRPWFGTGTFGAVISGDF
jgi:hypothetical protein